MFHLALFALLLATTILSLRALGRVWGVPQLWTSDVASPLTSQTFADPYSFTHLLHGFAFYAATHMLPLSDATRFLVAAAVECAWEVAENTPAVIDRYRETAAIGYTGDSVLNSMGDIVWMVAGYALAAAVPWQVTAALTVLVEVALLYAIRDNLTLNLLMLIAPNDRIKRWQMAV